MYQRNSEGGRNHVVFHAACQCVFYILCYRTADVSEVRENPMYRCNLTICLQDGLDRVRALGLDTIVGCALNPLKECQSEVAKEFCRVMKSYKIGYFDTILK